MVRLKSINVKKVSCWLFWLKRKRIFSFFLIPPQEEEVFSTHLQYNFQSYSNVCWLVMLKRRKNFFLYICSLRNRKLSLPGAFLGQGLVYLISTRFYELSVLLCNGDCTTCLTISYVHLIDVFNINIFSNIFMLTWALIVIWACIICSIPCVQWYRFSVLTSHREYIYFDTKYISQQDNAEPLYTKR